MGALTMLPCPTFTKRREVTGVEGYLPIINGCMPMLQSRIDPSQRGRTAALLASGFGKTDCLKLLIERGANVHAGNIVREGMPPTRAAGPCGSHVHVVWMTANMKHRAACPDGRHTCSAFGTHP